MVYNPPDIKSQKCKVCMAIDLVADANNIVEICQLKHKFMLWGSDQFVNIDTVLCSLSFEKKDLTWR